jgi:hypothetical protein
LTAVPRGVTHEIRVDREHGVVTKPFRSWARDEPAREWAALRMLAESGTGLAARPISASRRNPPGTLRRQAERLLALLD